MSVPGSGKTHTPKAAAGANATAAPLCVPAKAPVVLPDNPEQIESWLGQIWHGDCLELMALVPEASIDLILADLPYGTTRNKWDSVIPLDEMWAEYARILKPSGCVVLTAAQPFSSHLVMSNPDWFRYEWVWSKTVGSGQLNINKRPLVTHETILVFSPKAPPYYPQMTEGTPYTANRKTKNWEGRGYNDQKDHKSVNTGTRHPKSVLLCPNPRIKNGHPTQKPVALMDYLIRTYTEEGGVVLDNVMGSGTTAVAAVQSGRAFIGMEKDETFVRIGTERAVAAALSLHVADSDSGDNAPLDLADV